MPRRFLTASLHHHRHHLSSSQTLTLKSPMGSRAHPTKRPFCPRCSKPARVCLCSRLKFPRLPNPVHVTILQHSLEKDHPLNSTRVAVLGLKNLRVVPVTDVNFRAHLTVVPNPDPKSNFSAERIELSAARDGNVAETRKSLDLDDAKVGFGNAKVNLEAAHLGVSDPKLGFSTADGSKPELGNEEGIRNLDDFFIASNGEPGNEKGVNLERSSVSKKSELGKSLDFSAALLGIPDDLVKGSHVNGSRRISNGESTNGYLSCHLTNRGELNIERKELDSDHTEDDNIAIFDKYRVACSSTDLQIMVERAANPDIGWVLDTPVGRAAASRGFTVKRLQRKQLHASEEFHDFVEFEIAMPAGTALLFPSGKSVIPMDEVDFEVKHLVVLDGTWKKARRIYSENPWLQLLPHLKLVPRKESLYSEVRHQPKAGCLSTIESIVCALKGLGNDMEGLDELLDVFEAMVGDQRRLKAENLLSKSMS